MTLPRKTILVTGADGQLGSELRQLASSYPQYVFLLANREQFPLDNFSAMDSYFKEHRFDYCINCAAYTAVDKAETETEKAFLINGEAVGHLAALCKEYNASLIHISTDYVFNGNGTIPYKESDPVDPVNIYGGSKLKGEQLALHYLPSALILRTSWVYSSFGNNFLKTMLRLMAQKESLNVVSDQKGCPTYAADLAQTIMEIIAKDTSVKGIYNYCNSGVTTWFDFADAIRLLAKSECEVRPIPTSSYPTPAKRPLYSVLDNSKISEALQISIPGWHEALVRCYSRIEAAN